MKASFKVVASLMVVCLLTVTGCSSLDRGTSLNGMQLSDAGQNKSHMLGTVSGLYFLPWVPLITGNTDTPESFIPVFLQDTASLDGAVDMVSKDASRQGAKYVTDMSSGGRTIWLFPTFVLFWKTYSVSANAVE